MTQLRGYKVFNEDMRCRGFQFEVGKRYKHDGEIKICESGFHFCLKAAHCFSYYDFKPENIVCEVIAHGKTETHDEDSKVCTDDLEIVRKLTWPEVLTVANDGKNNSGHSNSGYRNSGSWNSGSWNSGDRNSGDRNSGDRNSGDRNSGSWNSGDRNSGDSNSGYRNVGAFCTDVNPKIWLFDKPTNIGVREWEESEVVKTMYELLDITMWVESANMTQEEKERYPKHETTGGYLKTKTIHEAWRDMWGNLSDKKKKLFTDLPNFDADKFKQITGIDVTKK